MLALAAVAAPSNPLSNTAHSQLCLTDLAIGDRARVVAFSDPDAPYTASLTRLGLTPGTEFSVLRYAPLGDPIEIRFRGFSLALRPAEAAAMQLERI